MNTKQTGQAVINQQLSQITLTKLLTKMETLTKTGELTPRERALVSKTLLETYLRQYPAFRDEEDQAWRETVQEMAERMQ